MVKASQNVGFNAGIGLKSDLYRYATALKGAGKLRKVEQRLNAMQAVNAGRDSTEQLFDVFEKKRGKPEDFAIFVPFCHPEKLGKLAGKPVILNPRDKDAEVKDLKAVSEHHTHIAVGFVVCWLHREAKHFVAHPRPLLLDEASLKLLDALVDDVCNLKDWRLQ